MIMLVILIPVLTGVLVPLIPFKKRSHMELFLETMVILNSLLVWYLLMNRSESIFTLANFTGNLSISFKVDGMSIVFGGLVSALWPFATLYAFEYMTKEEHEKVFFMFYTMTYGVTLGISLAANLLTMYFFYELLTLVTVPLVMHTLTREAILASRKYLYYNHSLFLLYKILFVSVLLFHNQQKLFLYHLLCHCSSFLLLLVNLQFASLWSSFQKVFAYFLFLTSLRCSFGSA